MRRQAGFTLIELIAAIVLMGFIAIFASIFISTGVRGTLTARQTQENALKAQIALDRIAIELRDINGGPGASNTAPIVTATSIQYTSSATALSGTRTLAYTGTTTRTITLTPASGGTAYTLVDGVSACTMSFTGTTTSATITVSFSLTNAPGSFTITVKPRNAIPTPVTS